MLRCQFTTPSNRAPSLAMSPTAATTATATTSTTSTTAASPMFPRRRLHCRRRMSAPSPMSPRSPTPILASRRRRSSRLASRATRRNPMAIPATRRCCFGRRPPRATRPVVGRCRWPGLAPRAPEINLTIDIDLHLGRCLLERHRVVTPLADLLDDMYALAALPRWRLREPRHFGGRNHILVRDAAHRDGAKQAKVRRAKASRMAASLVSRPMPACGGAFPGTWPTPHRAL